MPYYRCTCTRTKYIKVEPPRNTRSLNETQTRIFVNFCIQFKVDRITTTPLTLATSHDTSMEQHDSCAVTCCYNDVLLGCGKIIHSIILCLLDIQTCTHVRTVMQYLVARRMCSESIIICFLTDFNTPCNYMYMILEAGICGKFASDHALRKRVETYDHNIDIALLFWRQKELTVTYHSGSCCP